VLPCQFMNRYRDLYVRVDESRRAGPFALTRYVNPITRADEMAPALAEKDEIIQALRSQYRRITGRVQSGDTIEAPRDKQSEWYAALRNRPINKQAMMRSMSGRGAPEEIEMTLEAAVACGRIQSSDTSIQGFIDKYMGLDCAGFVGNYFKAIGFSWSGGGDNPTPGPSTPPRGYASKGTCRSSGAEVATCDVILFPQGPEREHEHVAIVGHVLSGGLLTVCESSGSFGLSCRHYRLTGESQPMGVELTVKGATSGTLLEVHRPARAGGTTQFWLMFRRVM